MRPQTMVALWLLSACDARTAGTGPAKAEAVAGAGAQAEFSQAGGPSAAPISAHGPQRAGAMDREQEMLGAAGSQFPDDFLLDLPGSSGLYVNAAADVIADGGVSIGTPQRGRLHHGVELPLNPSLYTRRRPQRSFGSTRTIRTIQTALTALRTDRGVDAEVVIGDISLPGGGPFAPHVSHQSGRDIDIRLMLRTGLERTTVPFDASQVDWDATWSLVHSFLETGEVTHVFLDFSRQSHLHDAAIRAGIDKRVAQRWFQWPQRGGAGMIAHEDGHRAHVHIRLACGYQEPGCAAA